MTEEKRNQIIQNAEAYAAGSLIGNRLKKAYIQGAFSREPEIEKLKASLEALTMDYDGLVEDMKDLRAEMTPWFAISGTPGDKMPENVVPVHEIENPLHCLKVTDEVLCIFEDKPVVDYRRLFDEYEGKKNVWIWGKLEGCNVTQWMPIPAAKQ